MSYANNYKHKSCLSAPFENMLGTFLEENAVDLLLTFLKKSSINNGRITFVAAKLLAELSCHGKVRSLKWFNIKFKDIFFMFTYYGSCYAFVRF